MPLSHQHCPMDVEGQTSVVIHVELQVLASPGTGVNLSSEFSLYDYGPAERFGSDELLSLTPNLPCVEYSRTVWTSSLCAQRLSHHCLTWTEQASTRGYVASLRASQ